MSSAVNRIRDAARKASSRIDPATEKAMGRGGLLLPPGLRSAIGEKPPAIFYTKEFDQELADGEKDFFEELPLAPDAPRGLYMAATLDICRMAQMRVVLETARGFYPRWFGLDYRGNVIRSRLILTNDAAKINYRTAENGEWITKNLAEMLATKTES